MINGFSFLGSFLVILTVVDKTDSKNSSKKYTTKGTFKELFTDIKYGLKYIRSNNELMELLILSASINFFLSFYNFLLPFTNSIFGNEEAYSRLLLFGALGSILGAFLSKFISNTRINLLFSLSLSGIGIVCIGLVKFSSSFILFSYIGNLIFMNFLAIYNIHFVSRIQQNVADEYLGRVFSAVFTIAILFMPLGTITITLIPWAVSCTTFMVIGFAITLLSLLFIFVNKRKD